MIVGLDHFALPMPVGQEQKARDYYTGILGLEEIPRDPGLDPGGCWFGIPDGREVHLQSTADFHPLGRPHPCFRCTNLEKLATAIEDSGFPIRWDDRRESIQRFFTRDPFGNRIEVRGAN